MAYKDPILFATLKEHNDHISFCHAGRDKCSGNYCYGPAVRNFYLVHFILSGKGVYIARGVTYHLSVGQSFIIHPGEVTVYTADSQDPWEYCFFAFDGKLAEDLLERTGFCNGNMTIMLNDSSIAEIIEETAKALNQPMPNEDMYALSQLFRIFKILMDHADSNIAEDTPTKSYVRQAISYIQFNYASKITIEGLADSLSINRSYFYRIFKAETGISPIEYLNNYRIDLAKTMLLESDMAISQIAIAAGFNTFSSFYRLFVMKYGNSPRQYRTLNNVDDHTQPGAY